MSFAEAAQLILQLDLQSRDMRGSHEPCYRYRLLEHQSNTITYKHVPEPAAPPAPLSIRLPSPWQPGNSFSAPVTPAFGNPSHPSCISGAAKFTLTVFIATAEKCGPWFVLSFLGYTGEFWRFQTCQSSFLSPFPRSRANSVSYSILLRKATSSRQAIRVLNDRPRRDQMAYFCLYDTIAYSSTALSSRLGFLAVSSLAGGKKRTTTIARSVYVTSLYL